MKAHVFLSRARQNLDTARLILQAGDANSACSRAYYAIRDAASAALCAVDQEEAAFAKTHSGLNTQFNLHLLKPGILPTNLKAIYSFALERRIVSDYDGVFLSAEDASRVVDEAAVFLEAVVELVEAK